MKYPYGKGQKFTVALAVFSCFVFRSVFVDRCFNVQTRLLGRPSVLTSLDSNNMEDEAATKLQARFRGFQARKKLTEQRQRDADILAYEKATREREFRMRQREEQKAMLLELPAGEVEDWQRQQEHTAATTVQSSFRRIKAKKEVAKLKAEAATRPKGHQKGAGTVRKGIEDAKFPRPNDALDREYPDPDAADVLTASLEASRVSDLDSPPRKAPQPSRISPQLLNSMLQARKAEARKLVGGVTIEDWMNGREQTRRLVMEHAQKSAAYAEAAQHRTELLREAEVTFSQNRSVRHGSLAELPDDADPENFPNPPGVSEKTARRLHQEAMRAVGGDDKWWKETARLNREQRVLDQQEEARRRKLLEQEVQATPGVTYKNNRDRAGVGAARTSVQSLHFGETEVY